jgi:hypothetical protein
MSDRMAWTDVDLDRALAEYFGMGAEVPTDRVTEAALLQVATTPQEGTRLNRLWTTLTASPTLSWTAAAVVALAVAIGVLVSLRPVGDPEPSPVPTGTVSPEATGAPSAPPSAASTLAALVPYTDAQNGYEVLVPETWRARALSSDQGSGVTLFQVPTGSTSGFDVVWISIGDASGRITLCRTDCVTETASTIERLADLLTSHSPGVQDGPFATDEDRTRTIDLGGEIGTLESPDVTSVGPFCSPNWRYHAFAWHRSRPVVIEIRYCSVRAHALASRGEPTDVVTRILESFRFLD